MNKSFFEEREISCTDRTNAIIETLPYFVRDFFVAAELRTSPLTRLNYAYDLRVFFDFLGKTKLVFVKFKLLDGFDDNVAYRLPWYTWIFGNLGKRKVIVVIIANNLALMRGKQNSVNVVKPAYA